MQLQFVKGLAQLLRVLSSCLLIVLLNVFPARALDETGKTFETPRSTIYYEVTGSESPASNPLIVVNGGPGFDHTYLHLSKAWGMLAKSRTVVFYDQRGTGRSVGNYKGQTFTLKDQIEDLEALRAHLGYEHIDLLGHSWGGFLVMAYAAVHPDRADHLAIVDSAAPKWKDTLFLFDDVFPETTERQAAVAFADGMGDKAAKAASMHEYLSMLCYSTENRDAFLVGMAGSSFSEQVNQAVTQSIEGFDLNPEIRKFRFPVLVLTGRYDMNVAPLVAYKIHQAIPGSKFIVFERSGHLPFYEEPEGFVRVIESFLSAKTGG
jgi:proline iminopeptidase